MKKLPKQLRFESLIEELDNHDCHKSPEDGCKVCDELYGKWPKSFKRIDRKKVWKEDAQSIIL